MRKLCLPEDLRISRYKLQASSSSIFFFSASSLVMRKLRTWPGFGGSRLEPIRRCCRNRRDRLCLSTYWRAWKKARKRPPGLRGTLLLFLLRRRDVEAGVNAFAQFDRHAIALHIGDRPVTASPSLCSAMYSSTEVGCSCFSPSRRRRFSRSFSSTCARTTWPTFNSSCG